MFKIFGSSAPRLTAADAVAMAAKGEITLLDVRELATERRGRVRVASSPNLSPIGMRTSAADQAIRRQS